MPFLWFCGKVKLNIASMFSYLIKKICEPLSSFLYVRINELSLRCVLTYKAILLKEQRSYCREKNNQRLILWFPGMLIWNLASSHLVYFNLTEQVIYPAHKC